MKTLENRRCIGCNKLMIRARFNKKYCTKTCWRIHWTANNREELLLKRRKGNIAANKMYKLMSDKEKSVYLEDIRIRVLNE